MYFGLFCFCAAVYICELREYAKTTVQHYKNKNNLISLVCVFSKKKKGRDEKSVKI